MGNLLAIAMGGALGAVLRYSVSTGVYAWLGRGFPYGTLVVNVLGSLLIGVLSELFIQRMMVSPETRAAILIGVLGAFTTFSTFSLETMSLLEQGSLMKAFYNVFFSVLLCLLATWLGLLIGRQI
jgi:CrcB protein